MYWKNFILLTDTGPKKSSPKNCVSLLCARIRMALIALVLDFFDSKMMTNNPRLTHQLPLISDFDHRIDWKNYEVYFYYMYVQEHVLDRLKKCL